MIPGPLNLARSDLVEWSPAIVNCIIQERCYARLDPRDDAENLLRQVDLIAAGEYNFVLKGPIDSPWPWVVTTAQMFHLLE